MLCEYGCGQEAKHQFKNGKWCCSESHSQCLIFKKLRSEKYSGKNHPLYGKKFSEESKKKMSVSHIGLHSGEKHWLYGKHPSKESIQKANLKKRGKPTWNKGLKTGPLSEETKNKLSISNKGKIVSTHVRKLIRERMLNGGAKHAAGFIKRETYEKKREWMLNGGAVYLIKHIKNPSKPEVMLRDIVKEIYPNCEFQYQVLNYALDVAIPNYKIAIEFDGWYHFDTQEHINYHKKRQREIEERGWQFIRYNIFSSFPDKNEVLSDIGELI